MPRHFNVEEQALINRLEDDAKRLSGFNPDPFRWMHAERTWRWRREVAADIRALIAMVQE